MVITTDEFIATESLFLCVSSKTVSCIWYRRWEWVGSTECVCWADMYWWGGDGNIYCCLVNMCCNNIVLVIELYICVPFSVCAFTYVHVSYVDMYSAWNVMVHAQKPDFVFLRKGRVNLNWQEFQFSRLLAAELYVSVEIMLDTPCSEVVWEYSIRQIPLPCVTVCHQVSNALYMYGWWQNIPQTFRPALGNRQPLI